MDISTGFFFEFKSYYSKCFIYNIWLKLSPAFSFCRFLAGELEETITFMKGHYCMSCLIIVLFEKNKIVVP